MKQWMITDAIGDDMGNQNQRCLLIKRLLNRLSGFLPGGYSLRPWIHRFRGARIGKQVWISQFVYIDEIHPEDVTIGDRTTIGLRSSIISHFYWGPRIPGNGKPVTIGTDVFVGPHCLILPGVSIGDGAVIQGGSVVSRPVPARTLWGPQNTGPIATVTVPLTAAHSYSEFSMGLRPIQHSNAHARRPHDSST